MKPNMKPFNFEEACAGKPVVDRNGKPVVITKFAIPTPTAVFISQNPVTGNHLANHDLEGKAKFNPAYDLFMASTEVTKYVNLYESPSTHYSAHPDEAAADFYAKHHVSCEGKKHNRVGGKAFKIVYGE